MEEESKEFYNHKISELYSKIDTLMHLVNSLQDTIIKSNDRINEADSRLQLLLDIGFDYDGFNTVESLKGLIDELCTYAYQAQSALNIPSYKQFMYEYCVYDIEDTKVLEEAGWKIREDSTFKSYKKEELIGSIRCLEHNWASEIKANLLYRQRLEKVMEYCTKVLKDPSLFNRIVKVEGEN